MHPVESHIPIRKCGADGVAKLSFGAEFHILARRNTAHQLLREEGILKLDPQGIHGCSMVG